jgi:protein ImuA
MLPLEKERLIAGLKARIASHETGGRGSVSAFSLGAPEIDCLLPDGGIRKGALHEIAASAYRDIGAATGFLVSLALCSGRNSSLPLLWCETVRPPFDMGRLYGPGLSAFGMGPERLVLAMPPSDTDCLWTMEEALRSRAFAAVIGEIDGRSFALNLAVTRRLQLAAEESATPLLLFTGHATEGASVAVTRWRVASAPSGTISYVDEREMLPGAPRWEVALTRSRGGQPGSWIVEWDEAMCAFGVVSRSRDSLPGQVHVTEPSPSIMPFRQTA